MFLKADHKGRKDLEEKLYRRSEGLSLRVGANEAGGIIRAAGTLVAGYLRKRADRTRTHGFRIKRPGSNDLLGGLFLLYPLL